MMPYLSPAQLDDKLEELERLRSKEWRSLRDEDRMAVLVRDIKAAHRISPTIALHGQQEKP